MAGEKRYYERISGPATVPWQPFTALDIKVGEWEPILEGYTASRSLSNPIFMYACQGVDRRPGKVDIVRMQCFAKKYPIENDRYDQALPCGDLYSMSKPLSGLGTL